MKESLHKTRVWECSCLTVGILVTIVTLSYGLESADMETWDDGNISGWKREDALNGGSVQLTNPDDYLEINFRKQSITFPEVHFIYADETSSDGVFAGDYINMGITNVQFRVYCGDYLPTRAQFYLVGGPDGRRWYIDLHDLQRNAWVDVLVPLAWSDDWLHGVGPTETKFMTDLRSVTRIGLRIQRDGNVSAQTYGLDDFRVDAVSLEKDSDGDGMNDYEEYISGTDPMDSASSFKVDLVKSNKVEVVDGVVLRWSSVPARTYAVLRASNFADGFLTIQAGITSTPPVNVYQDIDATGDGPYFYKIRIE